MGAGTTRAHAPTQAQAPEWHVRKANPADAAAVAGAVAELLRELGSTPPPPQALEAAAREAIEDPRVGAVILAEAGGELVGVLGASWQSAMHVPGRYAVIQDLWVARAWRSRAVGRALLDALCETARELGVPRLEVGLPREGFAAIESTRAFYRANGFEPLGERMRRRLQ
jgi:GNAT superfamily N-acetyltransferase